MPMAAFAADISPAAPVYAPSPVAAPVAPLPSLWRNTFDLRLGGFAHAIGSAEKNTADIGVHLVLPSVFGDPQVWWSLLVPRPYVGVMVNLPHRSDSVRGGALWRFPLWGGLFAEGFFGGAYDDGSLVGDNRHNALGSHWLFNAGGSLGYRIDEHWSVLGTFDHLSNGKTAFHTGFARNVGVNDWGIQLSYAF
jgi:lipid A 3-O-deacylase